MIKVSIIIPTTEMDAEDLMTTRAFRRLDFNPSRRLHLHPRDTSLYITHAFEDPDTLVNIPKDPERLRFLSELGSTYNCRGERSTLKDDSLLCCVGYARNDINGEISKYVVTFNPDESRFTLFNPRGDERSPVSAEITFIIFDDRTRSEFYDICDPQYNIDEVFDVDGLFNYAYAFDNHALAISNETRRRNLENGEMSSYLPSYTLELVDGDFVIYPPMFEHLLSHYSPLRIVENMKRENISLDIDREGMSIVMYYILESRYPNVKEVMNDLRIIENSERIYEVLEYLGFNGFQNFFKGLGRFLL